MSLEASIQRALTELVATAFNDKVGHDYPEAYRKEAFDRIHEHLEGELDLLLRELPSVDVWAERMDLEQAIEAGWER